MFAKTNAINLCSLIPWFIYWECSSIMLCAFSSFALLIPSFFFFNIQVWAGCGVPRSARREGHKVHVCVSVCLCAVGTLNIWPGVGGMAELFPLVGAEAFQSFLNSICCNYVVCDLISLWKISLEPHVFTNRTVRIQLPLDAQWICVWTQVYDGQIRDRPKVVLVRWQVLVWLGTRQAPFVQAPRWVHFSWFVTFLHTVLKGRLLYWQFRSNKFNWEELKLPTCELCMQCQKQCTSASPYSYRDDYGNWEKDPWLNINPT